MIIFEAVAHHITRGKCGVVKWGRPK